MKKTPKSSKIKGVDVTKPLDIEKFEADYFIEEDDCFGKEWDMSTPECAMCHDNEVCGILTAARLKKKVAQIEKKTTFLDKTYFSDKLEQQLDTALKGQGKLPLQDVYDVIHEKARTVDKVAVREWVKRFASNNNYLIQLDEIWKLPGEGE